MGTLPAAIDFVQNPAASPARMNTAMASLDARLRTLELPARTFDQVLAGLQTVGLERINDALQPYYQQLAAAVAAYTALVEAQAIDGGTFVAPAARIRLRRSETAGEVPVLLDGETAINEVDGLLYWRDAQGAVRSTSLLGLALLASPAFTGAPTAPTPAAGDNSGRLSTTAFVTTAVAAAVSAVVAQIEGNAPGALDTLKELADALGDDANFAATMTGALANRLRVDAAQSFTPAQAAQGRINLGAPAPAKIAAATAIDPLLGAGRDHEFMGAFTATAPAVASVSDGWRTGTFHNRGNGSIATANFVGTIAVPTGAYLDGTLNGTRTLAYGQKGYLIYDAQTTPHATWRWVWIDRTPLLLAASYAGIASLDFAIPAGYQSLQAEFCNFTPAANNTLGMRLSADGGSTVRSGGSDYAFVYTGAAGSNQVYGASTTSFIYVCDGQSSAFATSRSGHSRLSIDTKYGNTLTHATGVNGAPAQFSELFGQGQNEGASALITPNLLRFFGTAGGVFSVACSVIGIPAQ